LISQFYTLEELRLITPTISRFENLQKLAIMDASDDPPSETEVLRAALTQWATECPSLTQVQFSRSMVWVRMVQWDESKGHEMDRWVEMDVDE